MSLIFKEYKGRFKSINWNAISDTVLSDDMIQDNKSEWYIPQAPDYSMYSTLKDFIKKNTNQNKRNGQNRL